MQIVTIVDAVLRTRAHWRVEMTEGDDPQYSAELVKLSPVKTSSGVLRYVSPKPIERDIFAVRQAFFSVTSPKEALALFRELGPWQIESGPAVKGKPISYSSLMWWKQHYSEALRMKHSSISSASLPMQMVFRPLAFELRFTARGPIAAMFCKDIYEACRASIVLDRLDRNAVFLECAREKCGRWFKVGKDPRQLYCSEKCSRNERSRRYMKRKRGGLHVKKTRKR